MAGKMNRLLSRNGNLWTISPAACAIGVKNSRANSTGDRRQAPRYKRRSACSRYEEAISIAEHCVITSFGLKNAAL